MRSDGYQGTIPRLRNPVTTPGYWGMPEETAALFAAGGWLHTGDLVTLGADGTYTFVSRIKEVIRRRGENLSPLEVEELLEGWGLALGHIP